MHLKVLGICYFIFSSALFISDVEKAMFNTGKLQRKNFRHLNLLSHIKKTLSGRLLEYEHNDDYYNR